MPKKLGKGGAGPQNYVPPGNPAGGQYGDNESGSNKHFQSFKKPTKTSELSKKQIKEIGQYVQNNFRDPINNKSSVIKSLRWYGGTFGDLSNFTDEELSSIIDELYNLEKSDDLYYFKDGSKWKLTRNIGVLEKAGIPYFDKEGLEEEKKKELEKDLTNTKVQQKLYDELKNDGFKGAISLKGINDKNSTEIVNSIKTTIKDFSFLNENLISFGTEKGASALLEKEYQDYAKTPEYQKEIDDYKTKLEKWNSGRTFTKEEVEKNFKTLFLNDNKRTSSGKFWGVCGPSRKDSRKSWIQLKNSQYGDYDETVNKKYIEKYGYPANIGASFGATTYHELGHAICNYVLGGQTIFSGYADARTLSYIEEIKSKYNKPISYYGKTNISEYIAECVASHYTDGTNEQANEVFNVLLNKWKEMQK